MLDESLSVLVCQLLRSPTQIPMDVVIVRPFSWNRCSTVEEDTYRHYGGSRLEQLQITARQEDLPADSATKRLEMSLD